MSPSLIAALIVLIGESLAAAPEAIRSGDRLYLLARIVGCGDLKRVVDYSVVDESGEAALFGITLQAAGRAPAEIAAELADGIGQLQARRPKSLEITVVAPDDHKSRATLLMMLIRESRRDCRDYHRPRFEVPLESPPDYRIATAKGRSMPHNDPSVPPTTCIARLTCELVDGA